MRARQRREDGLEDEERYEEHLSPAMRGCYSYTLLNFAMRSFSRSR
jgi:hypothetical protein